MKISAQYAFLAALMLTAVTASCASIGTVNVWKDESINRRLQKVLVLAASEPDFMQKHFENVLCERLASRGIEAVAANKVFSQSGVKLGREAVLAKVREMGIGNILVARTAGKEETSGLYQGGVYRNPAAGYGE